jgi:hypothetical protein
LTEELAAIERANEGGGRKLNYQTVRDYASVAAFSIGRHVTTISLSITIVPSPPWPTRPRSGY